MCNRRSLFEKLFSPLAVVGVLSCGAITLIGAYLIHMNVLSSMMEQYEVTSSIFVDSISQDLVQGIESEVNRKCKALYSNPGVLSVYVIREGNERAICDLSKAPSVASQEIAKEISFGDTQNTIAGKASIKFKKQIVTSTIFWQYSLILLLLSVIVLVIYWYLSKYIIRKVVGPLKILSELLSSEKFSELKSISGKLKQDVSVEVENLYLGVEEQAKKLIQYEEQLVEKTRSDTRAEIAALVAHDIRSPLSGIAAVQSDPAIGQENQDLIQLSLEKINYLIDQILNKDPNKSIIFDIGSTINSVIKLKSAEYSNNKTEFTFVHLQLGTLFSLGIEKELERALSNIINNAFQAIHTDKAGKVCLTTKIERDELLIEVKDNGVGIPDDFVDRIGCKGESLKGNGTGLGIYQAKEAITQLKGKIEFKSSQNNGTTVTLKIPLAYKKETNLNLLNTTDHFLIIDDDPIVIDTWLSTISEVSKSNIQIFNSPSRAAKWINETSDRELNRYHAFVDYEMGDNEMNGISFLSLYKKRFTSSYLVTGKWKDVSLIQTAKAYDINIWPKDWISSFI